MNQVPAAPFSAICDLVECFQLLNIPYLVGGSVASSLFGRFRTTNDIDCLYKVTKDQVGGFLKQLGNAFIVDETALLKYMSHGKTYNIIHEETFVKVDLFPAKSDFHDSELSRAIEIEPSGAPCAFRVASPEDILLAKLLWIQSSQFSSERQIDDVKGIIAVSGETLDRLYLKQWVQKLNLQGVLEELDFNITSTN